ncbi:MAG: TlyA family RNA methyltransferase [Lachnospiraceae bacterium]|nr:TlyA family RNA methyltransferase [Lachnospiraceae bacterium]
MKQRLDMLLLERGMFKSRESAKKCIMAGEIFVNGLVEDKAGTMVPADAEIEHRGKALPYVSRGGLKLEKALKVFPIDLSGKICLDIGASTGGFTDCMLQNGAEKVYSVDVGFGQLDYSLRKDERVVCMERTNFRYLTEKDFPEKMDFASADVSFISLSKILPAAYAVMKEDSRMVCLIKPQFEAGKELVGKNGVVRNSKTHALVIRSVLGFSKEEGFRVLGLDYSPIRGPKGNIEYLLYLEKKTGEEPAEVLYTDEEIAALTERAGKEL